ncbi:TPA: DNA polymerase III subunit beta [Candidatus Berkelbacteria bacterium]|uniref:Beta sliding clamp n=1 Tax=Berkelbacteria bacterium GW2011_GWE1_39_12 TaxID=1618337 RepID=A0A0G4B4D5_9BACT|nr:MAG: polymerase III subunit beta, DNA polymerase III subunit beta protein [Berkelbacteria bacterium GW2011_GWE1_39_12]HBO60849.1 DNA polymerase III subunit beta [Candidatus Berkelbacteria bacterium]
MIVSCTQENLAKGLGLVGRSVGTRTTLPVLNNILIKTEKGRLKLSATDLEIGIHTWVGAKVDEEGALTIPAKLLLDYINTNNDKTIDFSAKDLTLHLKSEHYKANIKGIDAAEFPLIPEVKKAESLEIPVASFLNAITKTLISTALDESRPVLAGVFFKAKGNTLKMVATDSYRLSEQTVILNKKIDNEVVFIVPQKTLAEVGRILSNAGEVVIVSAGENQVEFKLGETILVSRLIEGTFPDYEQIIPKTVKTTVVVKASLFSNAIKMASLFARESANNIKLKIEAPDKVSVLAVSPHLGDNTSEITGQVSGEGIEIAFNAKFLSDVLAVINSENVKLELSSNLAAGLIKAEKDNNFLYVIMPLRVDE